ncbi:MAG: hypothetical protein ACQEQ7_04910 [Thermodesulfobacteriota bacterium]
MRAYLIDELSSPDMKKITTFLQKVAIRSSLEQIFWIPIPLDMLSKVQFIHTECQPHVFAVELGDDWIKVEFFVRTLKTMRCDCPGYCTRQQREYVLSFTNGMLEQLAIST